MKRGEPLVRRTPLRVKAPLRRSGSLARKVRKATRRRDTGPTDRVRGLVAARDIHRCCRCGVIDGWAGLQLHHRRPRMAGGNRDAAINQPANCLLLCAPCHIHVESYRDAARLDGYLLRSVNAAPTTPVLTWRGWVLLDNSGNYREVPA